MQRYQNLHKELLVLWLKWQRETIYNWTEDFQQLADTIEMFSLVHKPIKKAQLDITIRHDVRTYLPKKYIINLFANKCSEAKKLSVNTM